MKNPEIFKSRPLGISSRLRRICGARSIWIAENGAQVDLPVVVDHLNKSQSGELVWLVEARIELVGSAPAIASVTLTGNPSLDPIYLQRFFRWATPLEIVCKLVPDMILKGQDPFDAELPLDSPQLYSRDDKGQRRNQLSEDFLREVSRQYLEIGRGYAAEIARQRGVSARTVVSWIQKARARGILSETTKGKHGGELSWWPS